MRKPPRELDRFQEYVCSRVLRYETVAQVGLHPWEQHPERPTRLLVDVELYAFAPDWQAAALHDVVDYDRVRTRLAAWRTRPHTPLLETLALELIVQCFEDARVDAVRVALTKPDIFNEAEGAGIEVFRLRPQLRDKKPRSGKSLKPAPRRRPR